MQIEDDGQAGDESQWFSEARFPSFEFQDTSKPRETETARARLKNQTLRHGIEGNEFNQAADHPTGFFYLITSPRGPVTIANPPSHACLPTTDLASRVVESMLTILMEALGIVNQDRQTRPDQTSQTSQTVPSLSLSLSHPHFIPACWCGVLSWCTR